MLKFLSWLIIHTLQTEIIFLIYFKKSWLICGGKSMFDEIEFSFNVCMQHRIRRDLLRNTLWYLLQNLWPKSTNNLIIRLNKLPCHFSAVHIQRRAKAHNAKGHVFWGPRQSWLPEKDITGRWKVWVWSHIFINNYLTGASIKCIICLFSFFLFCAHRVRGKMRFWGKTKLGEKKSSRERLMFAGESLDGDYPDTAFLMAEGEIMVVFIVPFKNGY